MKRLAVAGAVAVWLTHTAAFGLIRPLPARPSHQKLGRFAGMRLAFERDGSRYLAWGQNYRLSVSPAQSVLTYMEGFGDVDQWFREDEFRLQFAGASSSTPEPLEDRRFDSAVFTDVYPGIDVECGGAPEALEYRLSVSAGADPGLIRIVLQGARKLRIGVDGSLTAATPLGVVRIHPPVAIDPFDGERSRVRGGFVLLGKGRVEFR